ncbi:MAG: Flp pilus assembly complex ATPase component TadA [Deltaproteobacteria bacterium]|nr:MAG: Flp pilus assembly complex ATPase component TadA [Deltaproteobacteria bacterium]
MYTAFYDLKEKPFNLTPSSRFLYLGESHREALNMLRYGVMERKGFILLTGEIGTGKTTMIQALLTTLDDSVRCIYLSNPLLTVEEFMDYLAFSAFKKKVHFRSKADFLVEFEEFLGECLRDQTNVILIIDEAQRLSFELLEEIRLLSNMETGDEKLINIFLVGQPELNDRLREQRCLPLLQRISMRYHIPPLDLEGTRGYVATRLKIAGAKDPGSIFSTSAVKELHDCSQGYPRMINILADNALLLGYSQGKKSITASMVKHCHDDMRLDDAVPKRAREVSETVRVRKTRQFYIARYWKWAAVAGVLILIYTTGLGQKGRNLIGELAWLKSVGRQLSSDRSIEGQVKGGKEEIPGAGGVANETQMKQEFPASVRPEEQKRQSPGHLKKKEPTEREELFKEKDRESLGTVSVTEAVICRDVLYGRPLVVGTSFKSSVYMLSCYTKIASIQSPTEISHVWYFGETEKARVKLPVKSSNWRIYSSKEIQSHEIGDWHVDVLGPQGELLQTLRFEITP